MTTQRIGAPEHPGFVLRTYLDGVLGLSVSQAARDLNISRSALHRVLAGEAGITAEMAARLGRLTGTPAYDWLSRQAAHDLWHVERDLARALSRIRPRRREEALLGGGKP